jgi:hypothetical protein
MRTVHQHLCDGSAEFCLQSGEFLDPSCDGRYPTAHHELYLWEVVTPCPTSPPISV